MLLRGQVVGRIDWALQGAHNVMNALAAAAAAGRAGVTTERCVLALNAFRGVRRRMETRGVVGGVTVYDDFAHHPTAIAATLGALRAAVGVARIVAVLEPRSNTMRLGVHRDKLAAALAPADRVWFLQPPDLGWDLPAAVAQLRDARYADGVEALARGIAEDAAAGDHVLVMSNGGFGGLHERLLADLRERAARELPR